ncbi:GMC oxidoreductase [Xylariaceae sp. FL1651]|nr:GMC oxidoreductase [Xylariaceae sp. FL1651]
MLPSYDFIIVGGGTAGLVLASRLSEDPRVKTPAFYQALMSSDVDWGFRGVPQTELNERSVNLHQGKALGVSSAINAHIFIPPTWGLVDTWQSVLGNEGYNASTLQKALANAFTFPSVDNAHAKLLGIDEWSPDLYSEHAPRGPILLSFAGGWDHPIRKTWADIFRDHSSTRETAVGEFSCLSSIHPTAKERSYAASEYYILVKERSNLHVMTNAVVERIVFDESNPQQPVVNGVQCKHNGIVHAITATREVIISAGAFQSPKILELSGIGNQSIIDQHGIKLVKHLPAMRENLQDHLICGICYKAQDDLETLDDLMRNDPVMVQQAMEQYATERNGPLSSIESGRQAVEEVFQSHGPSEDDGPEKTRDRAYYEIMKQSLSNVEQPSGTYLSVVAQQNLPVDSNSSSPTGPVPRKFITLGLLLCHPLSRGGVHVTSDGPAHMLQLDVLAQPSHFSKLLRNPLICRDPASHLADADAAKKYLANSAISIFHYVGTCSMLPESLGGVVDSELKVHGVRGLRVVDSSVIPLITTGNTQSMVYAVAERAVELIKGNTSRQEFRSPACQQCRGAV